jgi:hypothetical protein
MLEASYLQKRVSAVTNLVVDPGPGIISSNVLTFVSINISQVGALKYLPHQVRDNL